VRGSEAAPAGDPSDQRRPRSRRLPRAVRQRQIVDAAIEVFAEHGFHQASMDEISETAGVSKPMLYAYLGSKDELFLACVRREATQLIEAISGAADNDLTPDEQLWHGLRSFFAHVSENRASWTLLHRLANSRENPYSEEMTEWREQAVELIAALLARATTSAEQPLQTDQMRPFAVALAGASESLVEWWDLNPDHTADGLARRLMNLVWMGFGDLVEGRSWEPSGDRA
jgi:AcrR family transcriptional regulator